MKTYKKGLSSALIAVAVIAVLVLGGIFLLLRQPAQQTPQSSFDIENVDGQSGVVTIKNTGSVAIDKVDVYLDGKPAAVDFSSISADSSGDITFKEPLAEGSHTIRIVAGNAEKTTSLNVTAGVGLLGFTVTGSR